MLKMLPFILFWNKKIKQKEKEKLSTLYVFFFITIFSMQAIYFRKMQDILKIGKSTKTTQKAENLFPRTLEEYFRIFSFLM